MAVCGGNLHFNISTEDDPMILDTMSYSIMAVVALLSFITVLLARLPEGCQDNRNK